MYLNKSKDKLNYKRAIKKCKEESEKSVTDQLHESLTQKNPNSFWKTWKNKLCKRTTGKIIIQGNPSDLQACNEFASFFQTISSLSSFEFDEKKQKEFADLIIDYTGDKLAIHKFNFSAELIALSVDKMKCGKSAGFDEITVEHVMHCHPVIYSLLAKLFNLMLLNSYVPTDFGMGITIPIPKNDNTRGPQPIASFRGISLSPIISKIFEHCILILFSDYLLTSDNQFGFKAKVGCTHAVYTLRKVVEHFISSNSTVNLCFLDMAKGFDKINHSVLLMKLMRRRIPVALVKLLSYWYIISYNCVRWGDCLSEPYKLLAGVRQGGVLSPVLFAVYVNDFLESFRKFGCCFMGLSVSALMYADDLVLLAPSVTELQVMVNHCSAELTQLDLKINFLKSAALRIGSRFKQTCTTIKIVNEDIEWAEEVKYLGVHVMSGPKFRCNFTKTKSKFYRSANSILSKIGNRDNAAATVHLMNSVALPTLTYAIEALCLNKSEINSLNHPWDRTFNKIFKTFDQNTVRQCQLFSGSLTISQIYPLRVMSFLTGLLCSPNILLRQLYKVSESDEVIKIANLYECQSQIFIKNYRSIIINSFYNDLTVD